MSFPDFNENGDLPIGIYNATLQEVLVHFGEGSLQRQLVAARLSRIYKLAKSTNHLLRFIVYGSFVTSKPNPNDIDIFLVMDDAFQIKDFRDVVREIFEHLETERNLGASIFWMLNQSVMIDEKTFIEGWQNKRDQTRRGIVEIISND
jgi:hypothetical protein